MEIALFMLPIVLFIAVVLLAHDLKEGCRKITKELNTIQLCLNCLIGTWQRDQTARKKEWKDSNAARNVLTMANTVLKEAETRLAKYEALLKDQQPQPQEPTK